MPAGLHTRVARINYRLSFLARRRYKRQRRTPPFLINSSSSTSNSLPHPPHNMMFKLSTIAFAAFGAVFLLAGQVSALADNPGTASLSIHSTLRLTLLSSQSTPATAATTTARATTAPSRAPTALLRVVSTCTASCSSHANLTNIFSLPQGRQRGPHLRAQLNALSLTNEVGGRISSGRHRAI